MNDTNLANAAWSTFDRTTSRWGRITMLLAMVIMIGGPAILAAQLGVDLATVVAGVVAILVVFGVIFVVEPFSYYPILGPASMYQAFMIGNISNKLLPAAIVAQSSIGAKPETRRGQLAAVLAICGAAAVHIVTLAVFVGLFGTILLQVIPADAVASIQTFILPAVMGAVIVQLLASNPQPRILTIALSVGLIVQLVLTPLIPAFALFGAAVSVILTIVLALTLPGRKSPKLMDAVALEPGATAPADQTTPKGTP